MERGASPAGARVWQDLKAEAGVETHSDRLCYRYSSTVPCSCDHSHLLRDTGLERELAVGNLVRHGDQDACCLVLGVGAVAAKVPCHYYEYWAGGCARRAFSVCML